MNTFRAKGYRPVPANTRFPISMYVSRSERTDVPESSLTERTLVRRSLRPESLPYSATYLFSDASPYYSLSTGAKVKGVALPVRCDAETQGNAEHLEPGF